ncbi:aryl hydrocarbon receptor nuclear translocator homolog isoform X2 [Nematostella vectensis]|uniref:aryl hydrocarbon receptor nuclear translocator homolog isoform X2 n=1 Tax=Nematostella vectensis TaxID=45351 RepID=UPI00207729E8|nr:aryl hydrocarbon receptor nuclear translocator homolog isoform X2 [Nematostella vectensis]
MFTPGSMGEEQDDYEDEMSEKSSHGRLRKRKSNIQMMIKDEESDDDDPDKHDGKIPRTNDPENVKDKFARENHSEIERRRRNKMNAYINELSDMVPSCTGLARKPDKLTVLRMAVNYMKTLRAPQDVNYKPSFLSDQELKHLILEAADGFLFVVNCQTATVVYVSDSISPVLNQSQNAWMNQCLYDLIHPEDVEKVRDQLSSSDSPDAGRVLDIKTGSVKRDAHGALSRMYSSTRRNFICRMRRGNEVCETQVKEEHPKVPVLEDEYAVVHCTGYLKNWSGSSSSNGNSSFQGEDPNGTSLVTIGRLQPASVPHSNDLAETPTVTEFISRHSLDGKFTFVDQRVTEVLGYQPRDMLGQLCYDFFHPDDLEHMMESYDQVMKLKGQTLSVRYRFRSKTGDWVWLRTSCFSFQNPYTDEAEYIVCNNNLVNNDYQQQMQPNLPQIMASPSGLPPPHASMGPISSGSSSSEYSQISPAGGMTSPEMQQQYMQMQQQQQQGVKQGVGSDEAIFRFSGGPKGQQQIPESGLDALAKAGELTEKRGTPVTSSTTSRMEGQMNQQDLDKTDFSAGQAGSLLAALVQRRNAMAAVSNPGGPTTTQSSLYSQLISQVNGGMGMPRPGMTHPMGQPTAMGDLSPQGNMDYRKAAPDGRDMQQMGQKGNFSQMLSQGRGMPPGAWPGMIGSAGTGGAEMPGMMPGAGGIGQGQQMSGMYGQVSAPNTSSGRGATGSYPYYQ